jgi:hypothetical protein
MKDLEKKQQQKPDIDEMLTPSEHMSEDSIRGKNSAADDRDLHSSILPAPPSQSLLVDSRLFSNEIDFATRNPI